MSYLYVKWNRSGELMTSGLRVIRPELHPAIRGESIEIFPNGTYRGASRRCQNRLLAVSGFINICDLGEFISSRRSLPRPTSCLGVVLSAEYLNSAHNTRRQRHHTWDKRPRMSVRA
jgi:hypothetical protein